MPRALVELMPLSDEELVARVVAGDLAVFELLMRRHNQRLYRVARSVVRNDLEAEDIVQDAYVRAYAHLPRFEGRSSVATWLTRIVFHEALRRQHRRQQERRAAGLPADRRASAPAMGEGADMSGGAEAKAMLTQALNALPTPIRTVVVLRLIQGLSTRETAECVRLSEANVKVMLHRGKRMLGRAITSQVLEELRGQYAFGAERCDRVVEGVFRRLASEAP